MIAFFTPFITSAIDFRYGYVFAACNVLGGLIVYFFLIEGSGRTLEEIDTMYIQKVKPWQSANWVAPSAEEMSRIRKEAGTDETLAADAEAQRGTLSGETEREVDGETKRNIDGEQVQHNESVIR